MTEKQMEKKIQALEKRVAKLERRLQRENGGKQRSSGEVAPQTRRSPTAVRPRTTGRARDERAIVDEILRKAGLLSELPPEAKARAARWRALPEDERKRILDEFYNLKLDKSLSDIIIENRR